MNTKMKKLTSLLLSAGLAVSVFGSLTVSANAVASSDVIISGVQEELETQPNETETITEPTTDKPTETPASASEISLNKKAVTLGVGEEYALKALVLPDNAQAALSWSSGNTKTAVVDSNGRIKAKAVGTAVITVKTDNGLSASCTVTVKKAPTKLSLNKTSITLGVGESYDLDSKLPSGEAAYSVVYTSNNTSVASVKASGGLVTANTVGTAVITATAYNGVKVNCTVTVKNAPTKLSLNKTSITLGVGESYDLNSKLPSGEASYSVVYTSGNTSVASVKASGGLVTANSVGTAVITATAYNGVKVNCTVTVKNAPTKLSLNKTSITLGVGESYDLNSKLPSGEASYSVVYTSGNTSVASVKASGGLVTANRVGTAVITATAYNGVKVNCTVTVKNAPTKLSLNKTSIILGVGESYDLDSKLPSGEASYSVVYTSGNTTVASVKASGGIVTANRVGTAVITATAYNGVKVNCTVTVKNAPTKLSLNKTSIILGVGESYDLNSKLPSGEASYSVVYTSNNSSVASVKASGGLVTAKKAGTATITAKTYNGKSVTCQVQVLNGTREYFTYKTPKNTKINFSMVIPNGCLYSYAEDGLFFVDEYNYNNGWGGFLGGLYIAYEFYEDYVPDYRHLGRKNGYDVGYLYITEPICDHNSSIAVEKWKTASSNMDQALSSFRFE